MNTDAILSCSSFHEILALELAKRQSRNPNYSLRSFALKLKMPAPALSEALNKKRGLSRARAVEIAKILEMTEHETEYFVALSERSHSRSKKMRDLAALRAQECKEVAEKHLKEDQFNLISEWYHLAILELSRTVSFKSCPIWISEKLGLSLATTKEAVNRLLRLKRLKMVDGHLIPYDRAMNSIENVSSAGIRKFHRDLIQKAEQAIEKQSVNKRHLSSLIFAIDADDEKQFEQAQKLIMEFNRKFNKIVTNVGKPTAVYCLTTQLFNLGEK